MFEQLIRDRIRALIIREGGGSLNSMRWQPLAKKIYTLQGGYPETKQGKVDIKNITIDDVAKLNQPPEYWVDLFETVVRLANKQM